MAYWKHLELDDQTRKALEVRDREARNKKLILLIFLAASLLVAYLLKVQRYIDQDTFELIFASFIGGFVGSSLNYIIEGQ